MEKRFGLQSSFKKEKNTDIRINVNINCFLKKASLYMFDNVLNTHLER